MTKAGRKLLHHSAFPIIIQLLMGIPLKHKGSRTEVTYLQELTKPVQEEDNQGLYQSCYIILESLPARNLFISEIITIWRLPGLNSYLNKPTFWLCDSEIFGGIRIHVLYLTMHSYVLTAFLSEDDLEP